MIQVIFQMNELEIMLFLTIVLSVDRSSQEKLDETTFRIVLLDINEQFKSKID